MQLGPQSGE
uniref:Uncharacterized protein n=1 Tax=Anguilla anguilla TaxID=7936 RepID=A0A0E9RN82_ANGAN